MLRALSLGAPPHGGIAPGIDRIVMLLCGEENLREVVLFPMNQRAEDLLMGAPSEVSPKQLRELHIRLESAAEMIIGGRAMRRSGRLARLVAADRCAYWLLWPCLAPSANAQPALKIFDAHLHYNQEPNPFYPLEQVFEIFRRNNVAGILATSRPNKGTHQLVDAKAPGLWVVPFIRPYRTRADIQTWFDDPATWELIQEEYKRGYHRGIGEFHIYGNSAAGPLVKRIVDFAVERDLYLHAHCDEDGAAPAVRA